MNTRVFALEYDAESLVHNGQLGAELWGTRDGGRTWKNYLQDTLRRSPMLVTVDGEGVFGFRIVPMANDHGKPVTTGSPRSGETPQVWIGVDLTKPTGRVTSIRQGVNADSDKLFITWEAADNQKLADHPITLAASETRGGPWATIAAGLDNSGQFVWLLRGVSMQRVYLRLEVRDEAGNVATFETPEPMGIDRRPPPPAIHSVQTVGGDNVGRIPSW